MNVQIKMLLVVGFTFRLFFFVYSSTSALSLNINPIPPCIRSCCLPYLPGCLMHVDCWVRHHVIFTIIIIILLPVRRVLSVGRSPPISMWGNAIANDKGDVGRRGNDGVARDLMWRGISLVGGQSLRTEREMIVLVDSGLSSSRRRRRASYLSVSLSRVLRVILITIYIAYDLISWLSSSPN